MEKNNTAAAFASEAVTSVEAAAIPIKATSPASDVAAGSLADAGRGQIPLNWDPYEEEEYIRPENPYDTRLTDPWTGELRSNFGSDDESRDTKACLVLRSLQFGQYDCYFANGIYMCPFCTRRSLGATDFNCVVRHAENIRSCNPKAGESGECQCL